MKDIINVAILGAGNIARALATAVNGIPDKACLYAVASRNLSKAQEFASTWNVKKAYGSYEELASDENIDLVYIATPHSEHYKNTKLCLESGRNCLVEKAFCANLSQTKELIELAKSKNLLLAEAMWTRYQPSRDIICAEIESGIIGDVHYMLDDFSIGARGVERLEKPELCGGALLDLGVYSLTTALMFMGTDIKSVRTNTELNEYGVDLTDEITLVYKDGRMAKCKCSFGYEGEDGVSNFAKIVGDKGYMTFGPINVPDKLYIYNVDGDLIKTVDLPILVNGYEYQVLECRDAINEGRQETKSMPWSETIRMMGWMDSIRNHVGVKYPFEKDEDRSHSDIDVWGALNAFDDSDPWDRSNTTSFLEIYDVETNERTVVGEFDKVIEAPNWSHDGKFLVYNSEGKVYKFDLDSRSSMLIESGDLRTMNNDHVLASDDSEISVSDETKDGKSRIYTFAMENGEPHLITVKAPSYLHGLSNDKTTYCYCAERDGEYDIYTIKRGSEVETRLTTAPCLNDGPEYDSEDEYIYFNSVRTGLMQAWRMKADGTEQTQLTFDKDLNTWFPHISPDRTKIVMVSYYKGDLMPGDHVPNKYVELRTMNADGSDLKTVIKLFGGQGTINVNSWSPDSKKFAFVSYRKNN